MPAVPSISFEARKTPIQARSAFTVDAISEATIQVLLSHGMDRLTTTRVAQRAGVSVGTLYQYYPNKQALLFAILYSHLDGVANALEQACLASRHQPLATMIPNIVEAFIDAKMHRTDISAALYRIAAELGGASLSQDMAARCRKALESTLLTAPDVTHPPDKFAVQMMFAAMAGATRAVIESGAPSPSTVRHLRKHLVLLCQSYMGSVFEQSM